LQTGGAVYFGALHLVNRAINLVATYILVRSAFVKPKMPIYEGQLVTPKGQRPVILVEQRQKCFYQVQRTEICCRFYQVHLNHTQALPTSGVYFNFNLTLYFGALHLVNRAINLVATYITVRSAFVKPKMPIYEGQILTPKGQRPVILVEQRQKCFYQVQRTEICCPF